MEYLFIIFICGLTPIFMTRTICSSPGPLIRNGDCLTRRRYCHFARSKKKRKQTYLRGMTMGIIIGAELGAGGALISLLSPVEGIPRALIVSNSCSVAS